MCMHGTALVHLIRQAILLSAMLPSAESTNAGCAIVWLRSAPSLGFRFFLQHQLEAGGFCCWHQQLCLLCTVMHGWPNASLLFPGRYLVEEFRVRHFVQVISETVTLTVHFLLTQAAFAGACDAVRSCHSIGQKLAAWWLSIRTRGLVWRQRTCTLSLTHMLSLSWNIWHSVSTLFEMTRYTGRAGIFLVSASLPPASLSPVVVTGPFYFLSAWPCTCQPPFRRCRAALNAQLVKLRLQAGDGRSTVRCCLQRDVIVNGDAAGLRGNEVRAKVRLTEERLHLQVVSPAVISHKVDARDVAQYVQGGQELSATEMMRSVTSNRVPKASCLHFGTNACGNSLQACKMTDPTNIVWWVTLGLEVYVQKWKSFCGIYALKLEKKLCSIIQ